MARFSIDDDLVRRLAQLLDETGLSEIEYAAGETRIRVARALVAPAAVAPPIPVAGGDGETAEPAAVEGTVVRAPMVGTVFAAPEPGATPFVRLGDSVAEGQTLFLIEAMKTYNPVRAPCAGIVARILVTDSAPVEYDEELLVLT
jgi:acetyl-CoA carboxylase biotin carboxyl carrier protein